MRFREGLKHFTRGIDALRGYEVNDGPPMRNVHQVPGMPIMIDQTEADPRAVREFVDEPLYTVVDRAAHDGEMLQVFTSERGADEYRRHLVDSPEAQFPRTNFRGPQDFGNAGYIRLRRDINIQGCEWDKGAVYPDPQWVPLVTDFRAWMCNHLIGFRTNANDQVSSADINLAGMGFTWVTFYEHIHFFGSYIQFPSNAWVNNFVVYGWNDRASSFRAFR